MKGFRLSDREYGMLVWLIAFALVAWVAFKND